MRDYEIVLVVHPDLDETAFGEVVSKVQGWITDSGGQVVKTDLWGKRRLAYPIRKTNDGQYVLIEANMAPAFGVTMERNLRFLEPVMRFQVIAK